MSRPRGSAAPPFWRRRQIHCTTAGVSTAGTRTAAVPGLTAASLAVLTALATGCPDRNRGVSPDGAGLFFPAGTVLDPRVPAQQQARWLYVLNANSDLVYNAGTLVPVDIKAFYRAWMRDPDGCFEDDRAAACQPGGPAGSQSAEFPGAPVIGDVGAELTADVPCRRNALKPQVIECEDTYFIAEDAEVLLGNFGTSLRGWVPDPNALGDGDEPGKLLVAVRGDPSVTVIDLSGDPDDTPTLECGQGPDSGMYDPRRCAGASRLRFIRNDEEAQRIGAEPSNILATSGDPKVLVTHATSPVMTLIDLDGQYVRGGSSENCKGSGGDRVCKDGRPAIVHTPLIFDVNGQSFGGWGLARRPCFPGTDNVPALSVTHGPDGEAIECGRSLIYAGFRTGLWGARLYVSEGAPLDATALEALLGDLAARIAALQQALDAATDPDEQAALTAALQALLDQQVRYQEYKGDLVEGSFSQRCLTTREVENGELEDEDIESPYTKGAFICDARLYTASTLPFRAAAFDIGASGSANVLGDIAFSKDGNRMFAVQTTPGALAYVDTSLDSRGLTRDTSAGVVELCAQPTAMAIFSDADNEYAAVTCYKPSELFIIDLSGVRVVANMVLGTGPHSMTVDEARDVIYVANSLDKTISVVDTSPHRPTRFSEIARIGRQVPYLR